MTSPTTPPPPPPSTDTTPRRARGGVIALILGIVALIFAFIPFLSYVAGFIGIAAIVVGAVALRNVLASRGAAITGLILGILSLVLAIVMSIVYSTIFFIAAASQSLSSYSPDVPSVTVPSDAGASVDTPSDDTASGDAASSSTDDSSSPSQRTVTYKVTGSGTATTITYLTVNGGQSGQEQANDEKLPWKKVVNIKDDGLFETSIFSLVAQNGGSGKITCEIKADGKVISKHTSSGQYAVVTCEGQAGQ